MRRGARTAASLLLALVVLAAVTVLAPAAGAATARAGLRQPRPQLLSSAALSRSPEHALRAAHSDRLELLALVVAVFPARGTRRAVCALEVASGPAFAGGDPVNGSDPTGLKGSGHPPGVECGKYGEGSPGWDNCVHQLEHPDYSYIGNGCWGTESFWNCFNMTFNPGYWAVAGFGNEINAVESGCGFWQSFEYGLQGTAGLVATGAFAGGVVTAGGAVVRGFGAGAGAGGAGSATFAYFEGTGGIYGEINPDGIIEFAIERGTSATTGGQMFDAMMQHFGDSVTGVEGNWTYGDNLASVNAATANGVSLDEAVSGTWTAQQAARYGFTRATIQTAEGTPGSYSKLQVLFQRP